MRDDQLLNRLPYHANGMTPQVKRLLEGKQALGVITEGEEGVNLYPHARVK